MRAQFASLWNLLQECRSLEPRAGKIALHLRESLHAIGAIIGETTNEDILRTVFSKFCIGK